MRIFGLNIGSPSKDRDKQGRKVVPGYFDVGPEVAGGLGNNTVMDRTVHPPLVSRLHYEFDDWMDDPLIASFPCFLVTDEARRRLEAEGITGLSFAQVEISKSGVFEDLHPGGMDLPQFVWLKPTGTAGKDDVGLAGTCDLILSERALGVFLSLGMKNADISPFQA